ncbi:hypothetical protein ACFSTC_60370 [Nonomuraea ferruginea]
MLTIHIAALAAVDAHRQGEQEPADPARASAYLLRREREHWAELHRRLPEPLASDPIAMGRTVFTATFTRPLGRPDARQALRHADLAETVERANTLLDDHAYCYPPAQLGTVLEPLYPDRLAEDFAALAISDPASAEAAGDDWADHALSGLLPDLAGQAGQAQVPPWTRPALTMLIETARRWPHVAAMQLYPLLAARPGLMWHAGGAALARLATLPDIEPALLQAIEAHLPADRHIDLDIGMAALSTRLTALRLAATTDPAQHARLHAGHAVRLANADQHQAASDVNQQAVKLLRRLTELDRDAYLPGLAMSLSNHAAGLAQAGRQAEALPISQEAVQLRRELAALNRDAYLPGLAMSLSNHALQLAEAGRRAEALPISQEAVQLHRELAALNRDAYLPDLAMSLSNRAVLLAEAGRQSEVLPISQEAIELYRRLTELNRAAYLPDYVRSLAVRGWTLSQAQRYGEAVAPFAEALSVGQELPEYTGELLKAVVALLHEAHEASPEEVDTAFKANMGETFKKWINA